MPLDDLVNVIETLQQRIRDHADTLRQNEYRTCMALIDPLLTALGWDVTDPALVTPEYPIIGCRADYALLSLDGQPAALVAAEKLDDGLEQTLEEILDHAKSSGIRFAGLSDGNRWELYEVFKSGTLRESQLLNLSIANTPAHESTLKLLLLWRPNIVSEQPVDPVPEPAPEPDGATWVPLADIKYSENSTKPTGVKSAETELKSILGWQDLWFQAWEWLATSGYLNESSYSHPNARTRDLANVTGVHPSKILFRNRRRTSMGMYVECNDRADTLISNTIWVLERFRCSSSDVLVQFS